MLNHFYKLNELFLKEFGANVSSAYSSEYIKTDSTLLKSIYKELNILFIKISTRLSTKSLLQKSEDYPSSEKYNKLLEAITIDLTKLYKAQELIDEDLHQVLKFNSVQREKSLKNFIQTQDTVNQLYIKSTKNLDGGISIPSTNPFVSEQSLGEGSNNVEIDENRKVLTLKKKKSLQVKPINTEDVKSSFITAYLDKYKLYPTNLFLGLGSHWEKYDGDPHFSKVSNYSEQMLESPDSNLSIGYSEFEAVYTAKSNLNVEKIKLELGKILQYDKNIIYIDEENSLQGIYISQLDNNPTSEWTSIKLTIPFNQEVFCNQFTIVFHPNNEGIIPNINWTDSRVYAKNSNQFGYKILEKNLEANDGLSDNGQYNILFERYITPDRIELVLDFTPNSWSKIDFNISHYIYNDIMTYTLYGYTYLSGNLDSSRVELIYNKVYDIFVDSELEAEKEKSRAINILTNMVGST